MHRTRIGPLCYRHFARLALSQPSLPRSLTSSVARALPATQGGSGGKGRALLDVMGRAAGKFYAVAVGRKPGVYRTWDDCKEQTTGFSGSIYKSFPKLEEAEHFIKDKAPQAVDLATSSTQASKAEQDMPAPTAASSVPKSKRGAASGKGKHHVTAADLLDGLPFQLAGQDVIDPDAEYRLEFDGGSRGNPGYAGSGAVLFAEPDHSVVGCLRQYIAHATNNVAEYTGCILGIQAAQQLGVRKLVVAGDSMLIIQQLNGKWQVSNEGLKPLYSQAKQLLGKFSSWKAGHVYRNANGVADALANEAMDQRTSHGLKDMQGKLWLEDHAASSDQGQDPAEQDNGWLEQAESREDGGPDEEGNEQLSWSVAGDSAAERHDAGDSGQAAAVPSKQRKRSRARSTTETGENNAEPALDAVEQPVKRKRGRPRKHPPSPA